LATPVYGGHLLFASKDRIGARLRTHKGYALWVELDLNGNLVEQRKVDFRHSPEALTANGELYASVWDGYGYLIGTAVLNKASGKWEEIQGTPRRVAIGTEGEQVVYRMKMNPPISYLGWFEPHRLEQSQ
jgi:hypothetical protein